MFFIIFLFYVFYKLNIISFELIETNNRNNSTDNSVYSSVLCTIDGEILIL